MDGINAGDVRFVDNLMFLRRSRMYGLESVAIGEQVANELAGTKIQCTDHMIGSDVRFGLGTSSTPTHSNISLLGSESSKMGLAGLVAVSIFEGSP